MPLIPHAFQDLRIDDEPAFAHVGLYGRLKAALASSGHVFLVPDDASWVGGDRALFLNQTYWASDASADVLAEASITADEVTHIALHGLAKVAVVGGGRPKSPRAFLFAESIASAFDLYLIGRLLRNRPDSAFIESQVPIIRDAAEDAGLHPDDFAELLGEIVDAPERAFEDLRRLLFDTATRLLDCDEVVGGQAVFEEAADHRFAPLLHHYQLSNWVLFCRAYGTANDDEETRVDQLDAALRAAPDAVAWLEAHWLTG
ncbi:MAG: hypothetical protein IV100_04215 [Myxococcales bacterium]|nr:hypothetical protein [Myxococcales bacterium]